jgi:AcrR family transcriptional regulator
LILDAARELFVANGYEATTTWEISERADVTEKLIFNNFGSKANLFEAAVLTDFERFVEVYRHAWETESADSTAEERMELFVRGLFDLAEANQRILRAALAAPDAGDGDPQRQLLSHWAETLQSWQSIAATVRDDHHLDIDPPASIAAAAAMVFGMVLLKDMLFSPAVEKPDRERRIAAMTRVLQHGLLHTDDGVIAG